MNPVELMIGSLIADYPYSVVSVFLYINDVNLVDWGSTFVLRILNIRELEGLEKVQLLKLDILKITIEAKSKKNLQRAF